jgi:5-methylthioribose kinase
MRELTPETVADYLRETGRVAGPAEVTLLAGGVSNMVFRVRTEADCFVLKQSRPQLRTRDAWFSDVRRIFRELEVMRALADVLAADVVPRVLWEDRENFAFAMSHAPAEAVPWKDVLLAGTVEPPRGAQAGEVLGKLHEFSATHPERFAAFSDPTVFVELRAEPFYERVQRRCPDVAAALEPLLRDFRERRVGLCHGDYTPKNMLLHERGFTLVDYETATLGEPAMDLGLFVAHLVLKAVRRPGQRELFRETIRRFWLAYAGQVRTLPLIDQEARGLRHLGACLRARVDGASPVDYLPAEEQKERVRALSRALLFGELAAWEAMLAALPAP